MSLAFPAFIVAAAVGAASPYIETAPYSDSPSITKCVAFLDNTLLPETSPVQSELGQVCRFSIPQGIGPGAYTVFGYFKFAQGNGQILNGPVSRFGFRKYIAAESGAMFWTWENAVVCEANCVSQ